MDRVMTMMSKLTAQDDEQNKQFKPKVYQGKRRGQMRNPYDKHNYDQRNQHRYRSNSRDRRISFSGRIQCGQDYKVGQGIIRATEMTLDAENTIILLKTVKHHN